MSIVKHGEKYKIISVFDHMVLDVQGGNSVNNTLVIPYTWNDQAKPNQVWHMEQREPGLFVARSGSQAGATPVILDESQNVNLGHLIVFEDRGGVNQHFIFEPIKPEAFACYIKSRFSGKVIQNNGNDGIVFVPKDASEVRQRWVLSELDTDPDPDQPKPDPAAVVETLKPEPPAPEPQPPNPKLVIVWDAEEV